MATTSTVDELLRHMNAHPAAEPWATHSILAQEPEQLSCGEVMEVVPCKVKLCTACAWLHVWCDAGKQSMFICSCINYLSLSYMDRYDFWNGKTSKCGNDSHSKTKPCLIGRLPSVISLCVWSLTKVSNLFVYCFSFLHLKETLMERIHREAHDYQILRMHSRPNLLLSSQMSCGKPVRHKIICGCFLCCL